MVNVRYTRRRWLRTILGTPLVSLLLSCSRAGQETTPGTTATTTLAKPVETPTVVSSARLQLPDYVDRSALGKELFVFNWGDYIDPEVVADFERLTGVQVTIDTYETNEQAIAKLQQGGISYDVVVPTDYAVQILIGLGLLEPLDRSVVRALEHLDPNNLNGPYDPGNQYSVPYFWGTSGYAYDTAVLGEGLESWGSLFNPPEAARGKLLCTGTIARQLQQPCCGSATR